MKLLNDEAVFKGQGWFVKSNPSKTLKNLITNHPPVIPEYNKKYSYLDKNTKLWMSKETVNTWEK